MPDEAPQVKKSSSSVLGLAMRGVHTAAEAIGISYAMCIGPTLYERFQPMVESIGKLGFTEGWAEGAKVGFAASPAGLIGSGIAGRIATNLVARRLETVLGRKLGGNEKMLCEAMGAFVAVGLQVGVFSGAGLGALLSPAAGAALAYYAIATFVTSIGVSVVEKPLKSIANYSGKVFGGNSPSPAPA
jgi:hypothetical protein